VSLLDPLRLRIDSAARRSAGDAGRIEKRRGVHASAPVFAGTRIRVATVQRYLQQGYQTEAILQAFPDPKQRMLTKPDGSSPRPASAVPA
jgi:uncharacterized protein (DUF433 family)